MWEVPVCNPCAHKELRSILVFVFTQLDLVPPSVFSCLTNTNEIPSNERSLTYLKKEHQEACNREQELANLKTKAGKWMSYSYRTSGNVTIISMFINELDIKA